MVCFSTVGKGTVVFVAIAEDKVNYVLLQSVHNVMTRLKVYGLGSFLSIPLETPGAGRALRATPLVFERERFPVLRCVLIRAL